ncbi:MAG: hypothetical protein EBT06_14685 [Gammaproteobacteria bacterium]|nr:hypothetical protein [Gammaproteobacteria bacterium]NBT46109.1 hypothetical protein [Gammaproteobacteria bacterium]
MGLEESLAAATGFVINAIWTFRIHRGDLIASRGIKLGVCRPATLKEAGQQDDDGEVMHEGPQKEKGGPAERQDLIKGGSGLKMF